MVSIGPYHHGKDHLLEFKEYKWFFLGKFLDRTRNKKDIHDHQLEIMRIEAHTRSCYSANVLMLSDDFAEIILLDRCFLIEILCHLGRNESDGDLDFDDPIFIRPWLIPMLVKDIVELKNQLLMFVLKSLLTIKLILEFNDLGKNIVLDVRDSYLWKVLHDVDAYYSSY